MKALVTGGCGFIGSHLVERLLTGGWEVSVLDREESLYWEPPGGVRFFKEEFNNRGALAEALEGVDTVFHLAWSGVHQSSNRDLRAHAEMNLLPSIALFELAAQRNVRRVIFISSGGTVYGKAKFLPIPEDHPCDPLNGYGAAKLAAEQFLRLQEHLYGLEWNILRPSVPYGERQDPGGTQGAVAVFLGRALRGDSITIWGDGSVVRDFFYVRDLAEALVLAAESTVRNEVFNVGRGRGVSLLELVALVHEVSGREVKVRFESARSFDSPSVILDTNKIRERLEWQPTVDLKEGMGRTWAWISEIWA